MTLRGVRVRGQSVLDELHIPEFENSPRAATVTSAASLSVLGDADGRASSWSSSRHVRPISASDPWYWRSRVAYRTTAVTKRRGISGASLITRTDLGLQTRPSRRPQLML
jgi:hypothetical protein